ncbi:hypothetical protein LTR27_006391 [Elasticomyces elasticus]|nr:hypothetical protein LTR27_006391 [Elasticomyces elasticus]
MSRTMTFAACSTGWEASTAAIACNACSIPTSLATSLAPEAFPISVIWCLIRRIGKEDDVDKLEEVVFSEKTMGSPLGSANGFGNKGLVLPQQNHQLSRVSVFEHGCRRPAETFVDGLDSECGGEAVEYIVGDKAADPDPYSWSYSEAATAVQLDVADDVGQVVLAADNHCGYVAVDIDLERRTAVVGTFVRANGADGGVRDDG